MRQLRYEARRNCRGDRDGWCYGLRRRQPSRGPRSDASLNAERWVAVDIYYDSKGIGQREHRVGVYFLHVQNGSCHGGLELCDAYLLEELSIYRKGLTNQ